MLKMIDKNGVEVKSFLLNVYDETGKIAYFEDLGFIESPFPDLYSNYECAVQLAKDWIENELGSIWKHDFEVVAK